MLLVFSVPAICMENQGSLQTYTTTQAQRLQLLENWYLARRQRLIDQYFDYVIDQGVFEKKSTKLYKRYIKSKKQTLNPPKAQKSSRLVSNMYKQNQ